MVEQVNFYTSDKKPQAFRTEFYEKATDSQIEGDIISYLGEYRFGIPEFEYELGIVDGKLMDKASNEPMVVKAQRAIDIRQKEGFNTSRETAEKSGLLVLEAKLSQKPDGTVVWFSPPGPSEQGYGDYGFAYVGKRNEKGLKMTAFRLESPTQSDFVRASKALWGEAYQTPEDFLSSPQVIDIDNDLVKEFIHGNFEIKDIKISKVFERVRKNLAGAIEEFKTVVREGTRERVHDAVHAIENMSLKLKQKYDSEQQGNVIYIKSANLPSLKEAILMAEYTTAPPSVKGSCGISSKQESNDIFRDIKTIADKTPTKDKGFDFDQPGPCRLCEKDVPCGPCKICKSCNDKIDLQETLASAA